MVIKKAASEVTPDSRALIYLYILLRFGQLDIFYTDLRDKRGVISSISGGKKDRRAGKERRKKGDGNFKNQPVRSFHFSDVVNEIRLSASAGMQKCFR